MSLDKKIVKEGEIYTPQMRSNYIFYIEKGAVGIFNYEDNGRKQKNIALSRDLIGFEGLFGSKTYNNYAEILVKNTSIIPIKLNDFQEQMVKKFDLCLAFINYLENQKQIYERLFFAKSTMTSEDFLIQYLEHLAYKIGQPMGYEILVPFMPNHSAIADILSISRQTVTSTLNKLKKRNSIYYDRKKLIIRHPEGKVINNGVAQG